MKSTKRNGFKTYLEISGEEMMFLKYLNKLIEKKQQEYSNLKAQMEMIYSIKAQYESIKGKEKL